MMRMKKFVAMLLALVMIVGSLAGTVFATGTNDKAVPEAEVTTLAPMVLGPEEHTVWTGSGWPQEEELSRPLDVIMNFKALETWEQAQAGAFAGNDWAVDFYLTFGGMANGSMVADGCYLAGNYGDFGWIVIPVDGLEVENGVTYPVVSGYDAQLTYENICDYVKNFTAAIYFTPEILKANPNLTVTLQLGIKHVEDEEFRPVGDPAVYTAEQMLYSKGYVAKIGQEYYTLAEALATGGNITLVSNTVLTAPVTVPAGVKAVLDLNGKTISATDNTTGANFNLIVNKGDLEVKDSVGGGKISLTATANKGWSNSSSVISNDAGVLTITGGTLEHKGGSDMAYGIDNNSTGGETTLVVNGGTISSPYRAVRMFQNNTTKQNKVQINGGKLSGDVCVWMHQPSAKSAQLGTLKITGGTLESGTRAIVVDIMGGSKSDITISGGTFTNASAEKNLLLVWPFTSMNDVKAENKTTLNISGGTFNCAGKGKLIGLLDGAEANTEVTVSGGTFSEDIADAYLAAGVESVAITDKGVWVVHAHDKNVVIDAKDATCTEAGNKAGTKCSVCGKVTSGNEVVPAGHKLAKVEAKAATCTDAGNIEYYKCACGKLFNNEKAEKELAAADVVVAAAGHKLVKVEAKAATYTAAGNTEHYKCACGALFADAEGKTATTAEAVVIAQLIKVENTVAKVETSAVDKAIEEAKKDTAASEKVEVVIKVSDAKTEENAQDVQKVVEVELPVESLETVAEQKADLTVELPSATVTLDTEALAAVTEQAEGQTVSLVVKEVKTETLTDKQQATAKKYDVAVVVSAELICQQTGEKIWTEADNKDVKTGKITVRMPFTPAAGAKGSDYAILYVADDGSTKKIDSKYEGGCLVFTLDHFSDYIVVKEAQKPAAATPETGDMMLGMLGVTAMLSAAGVVALVLLKKRAYR